MKERIEIEKTSRTKKRVETEILGQDPSSVANQAAADTIRGTAVCDVCECCLNVPGQREGERGRSERECTTQTPADSGPAQASVGQTQGRWFVPGYPERREDADEVARDENRSGWKRWSRLVRSGSAERCGEEREERSGSR
ncbi:hypothetical protein VTN00DRAFT_155 [Thermoascus crustaceus]|uniref:uncharacterized protein n=1 Tax=Thermoascus crustaceus TaxID=5088 RepID=UPI0037427ECE